MARSSSSLGLLENISASAEGRSKMTFSETTADRRNQWVVDPEANTENHNSGWNRLLLFRAL